MIRSERSAEQKKEKAHHEDELYEKICLDTNYSLSPPVSTMSPVLNSMVSRSGCTVIFLIQCLTRVSYYDEKHQQDVSIDFCHDHDGVQPHRHVHMSHNKNDPGVPPTAEEIKLANKIKKEFNLK